MPHLLDLTLGTEFKGNDGETYKIVGNISEGKEILIRLELVVPVNEELQNLLEKD